jgi:hypothetical protein
VSTTRRAVLALLALTAAVVLIATIREGILEFATPSPPVGGISKPEAIAIATHQAYPTSTSQVRSAVPGPLWKFGHDVRSSPNRWVWAVTFDGSFQPPSCGPYVPPPAKPRCPLPEHTYVVILDYFTGDFIMASLS